MATRLQASKLLLHPTREAIVDHLRQAPGTSFVGLFEVMRARNDVSIGLGYGSLAYHLQVLERTGIVTSRRSGRHRRYYENGGPQGSLTTALAALQTPSALRIARVVLDSPGTSLGGIRERIAAHQRHSRQSVGYHLGRLVAHELVVSAPRGRGRAYFATEKAARLLAIAAGPQGAPLAIASAEAPLVPV